MRPHMIITGSSQLICPGFLPHIKLYYWQYYSHISLDNYRTGYFYYSQIVFKSLFLQNESKYIFCLECNSVLHS